MSELKASFIIQLNAEDETPGNNTRWLSCYYYYAAITHRFALPGWATLQGTALTW